jgi:hypothetical protein
MDFVIPIGARHVNSKKNDVIVRLDNYLTHFDDNTKHDDNTKYDIKSIMFTDELPDFIKSIEVCIGGQRIISVDKTDFIKDHDILLTNLCGCGIKLSKCSYMTVCLKFVFDSDYLLIHEEHEMVSEYKEVETYSDEEYEIYDGYEYHIGRRVHRREEPTGNSVHHITKDVEVQLPDIKVVLVEPVSPVFPISQDHVFPVWQTLTLPISDDPNQIQRLRDKFELMLADDRFPDLDYAIASRQPFTGKVKNKLRYSYQMAGLWYTFT